MMIQAVRGNLRAALMKSSFISGCVLPPLSFLVQLLTSVPYLCSVVSTGLSAYRDKTTISNFAAAGGKSALTLCASACEQGSLQKSMSKYPHPLGLSSFCAIGFCFLFLWLCSVVWLLRACICNRDTDALLKPLGSFWLSVHLQDTCWSILGEKCLCGVKATLGA